MKLQLKRSNVLVSGGAKEPTAAQLDYGELAINYSATDAAIFLKDSSNNVIRIAGVHNIADDGLTNVPTTTSPPTTPTPEAGNLWYNSEDGRLYIYYIDDNSSQWVDASPDTWQTTVIPDTTNPAHQAGTLDDRYVNINGDTLTGALLLDNAATVATPDLAFDGDANTGIYSPGADSLAITTAGTQRVVVDSSGNVGIGTTSPGRLLDVNGVIRSDGTSGALAFGGNSSTPSEGAAIHRPASNTLAFATDSTERLRIDSSGNVLIGTSSAPYALTADELQLSVGDATNHSVIQLYSAASKWGAISFNDNATDASNAGLIGYYHPNNYMVFNTNNTERMRIDSSGNVGIGATSVPTNFQVEIAKSGNVGLNLRNTNNSAGDSSRIAFSQGSGNLASTNTFADIIATADTVSPLTGRILFRTNQGNSLTEAMRISSSGKVGIGTTAPDHVLHLSSTNTYLAISDSQDSGGGGILFRRTDNGQNRGMIQYNFSNDFMSFRTSTDGNGECMRIDSGGNVGIGNSTPTTAYSKNLNVNGVSSSALHLTTDTFGSSNSDGFHIINSSGNAYLWNREDRPMIFGTFNTERMRLTSDGQLVIGHSVFSASIPMAHIYVPGGNYGRINLSKSTSSDRDALALYSVNQYVGGIVYKGASTAYLTSSDYRLKENVADLTNAISRLKTLPVHRFNFIAVPNETVDGFFAHEAQLVVPECVRGDHNDVDDDGEPVYQAIDQSKLVPLLTAALQEAIAKIETLEQRLSDAGIA